MRFVITQIAAILAVAITVASAHAAETMDAEPTNKALPIQAVPVDPSSMGRLGSDLISKSRLVVADIGDGPFNDSVALQGLIEWQLPFGGVDNFDLALSDLKIANWSAREDGKTSPQLHMSELHYRPDDRKLLIIEQPIGADKQTSIAEKIIVSGPGGTAPVVVTHPAEPSTASGSLVSTMDLSALRQPGAYTVTLPASGSQENDAELSFRIGENAAQIAKHRDDAWGVFYWITDNEDGPYPAAHRQDVQAKTYGLEWVTRDISGGWFDAGDYGKYTVNGAYSVGLMLLTGLLAPQAMDHSIEPLAGGQPDWPDWLNVANAQLDWLLKMQTPDGGVNHKATTRDWPGLDVAPGDDSAVKWIMPVSSAATADFAAVMALASKVLAGQPGSSARAKSKRFAAATLLARHWLQQHPQTVMIEANYHGNDYGGPYLDGNDRDERFFADAAWAALTRRRDDILAVEEQLAGRRSALLASDQEIYWGRVELLGIWALKSIESELSDAARGVVDAALRGAAQSWQQSADSAPWAIPHEDGEALTWGSNGVLATTGWHWLLWSQVGGDGEFVEQARDLAHWFFGRNPQGQVYVTGPDERAVKDPHFRPTTSGSIALPAGMLAGGPNSGGFSGDPAAAVLAGKPPMHMYLDDRSSYATNEVAINWQAAWALYLSLLAAVE